MGWLTQLLLQASADQDPQAWWQHAGRMILAERASVLGEEVHVWSTAQRAKLRRVYQRLYMQRRSRMWCAMPACLPACHT